MKKMKLAILILLAGCSTNKSFINTEDNTFFPMDNRGEVVFKYADSDDFVKYVDVNQKIVFDDKEYNAKRVEYSWGKKDTTYFRAENGTIYYFDKKSSTESIHMPKELKKGTSWTSADNAWKYEITSVNAKLRTPEKKYTGLLLIKATQLQNRDKTKLGEYLNYYEQNVGKVASVTEGKLMIYKI